MSDLAATDACYIKCNADGVYDRIYQSLKDMGPDAFANVDFGPPAGNGADAPHFFRQTTPKGYNYIWNKDGSQFSTILFGEIVHLTFGTIHCAKGNHYGKDGDVSWNLSILGISV